ncbi:malate synthase G [Bacillus sp. Marseille-P3800]|uniref:malate synthase G n=1 Tax=Bacillus sp. Marseille-P3800 TaxID=2014782 RepID=UPI000C08B857|nr:malate synthase G [Bacillus sp. Marseille-P3800]
MAYKQIGNLQIATTLHQFIEQEVLKGIDVKSDLFWSGFEQIIHDLAPINQQLLKEREWFQEQINQWHQTHSFQKDDYYQFLTEIGYLQPEPEPFTITTSGIDDEIATQAGPQLVVPINNSRFAINAANARWGSLYDALYGSDVIKVEATKVEGYDEGRGNEVIRYAKQFLDETVPLAKDSHQNVVEYKVVQENLIATLEDGTETGLANEKAFIGFQGDERALSAVLFEHHHMRIVLQIDRSHAIGGTDRAGISDIILESALTTIMDCEDSVTAVDAEDKVDVYRNWFHLMTGKSSASFMKNGQKMQRSLNEDDYYRSPTGAPLLVKGRSLMLIRNVGHLMKTDAIKDASGRSIPEGIMDGVITTLIAMHDLAGHSSVQNSSKQSIYIVKPKMHGAKEVAFAHTLFNKIEDLLGLERYTIKIGVMDEERRTSLNLSACIYEVKERIFFINTGFLDRTGDEIHTSMEAGPVVRKHEMKETKWIQSYEKANVQTGLNAQFQGKAQIGKGMWAMPDEMAALVKEKGSQLKAGASTAWVPSPTAATLHALHYHQINVIDTQTQLRVSKVDYRKDLLEIPLASRSYEQGEIEEELDNNIQSILGYVVRWIDQGIGCSKVPDIHHMALMEDRATLRISSQLLANWLYHGVCTKEQLEQSFKKMARVVDKQNEHDSLYQSLVSEESIAFQAAKELVYSGKTQPSGYTEPILHKRRQEAKHMMLKA